MIVSGISGWKPVADEVVKDLLRKNETVRVTPDGGLALYSRRRGNELDPFLFCDKHQNWWIAPGTDNLNPNPK